MTDTDLLLVKNATRSSLAAPSSPPVSTCPPPGHKTTAALRENKEAFYPIGCVGDGVRHLTARWRLFMGAATSDPADCMLSGSDYSPMETCFYILPAPISCEDRQWLTDAGRPRPAETMQSWRDNWRAVRSCLMETHFANLSGGCDVRAAAVSQSNTVFRAFFLFLVLFSLLRPETTTTTKCFDYDSARWLQILFRHIKEHEHTQTIYLFSFVTLVGWILFFSITWSSPGQKHHKASI